MELFSAVQERLQERLGPMRAWLFPPRVYLQLEDQAITAMALEANRITWLERVPLPTGLCQNGEPIRSDTLGDLLGDLLVERGCSGAHLHAVLPAAASQCRLVRWPDGRWPEDPERTLTLHEAELGLARSLQYLDLHLVKVDRDQPTSVMISAPSALLDRWIDVFGLAGVSLDRLEAASVCLCRAAQPLLQAASTPPTSALLQIEPEQSSLLVLDQGVPIYERRLPGGDQPEPLRQALRQWLSFWQQLHPDQPEPPLLIPHGSALENLAQAGDLVADLGCPWQCLDPLALGWLHNAAPVFGTPPPGPALACLWGLASVEVMG